MNVVNRRNATNLLLLAQKPIDTDNGSTVVHSAVIVVPTTTGSRLIRTSSSRARMTGCADPLPNTPVSRTRSRTRTALVMHRVIINEKSRGERPLRLGINQLYIIYSQNPISTGSIQTGFLFANFFLGVV